MEDSTRTFDAKKYLQIFYSYLNKKPDEEPLLMEFILNKLHEYLQESTHSS